MEHTLQFYNKFILDATENQKGLVLWTYNVTERITISKLSHITDFLLQKLHILIQFVATFYDTVSCTSIRLFAC